MFGQVWGQITKAGSPNLGKPPAQRVKKVRGGALWVALNGLLVLRVCKICSIV